MREKGDTSISVNSWRSIAQNCIESGEDACRRGQREANRRAQRVIACLWKSFPGPPSANSIDGNHRCGQHTTPGGSQRAKVDVLEHPVDGEQGTEAFRPLEGKRPILES